MHKTKRKIFEKSMELFAKKGYEATSIEEITAVAGIAKGTFYYHFSSKEAIFEFLIEEGMKLLKNNIEIKTNKLENSIDKIKAIILIQIKLAIKYENFIKIIISQMWGTETRNKICRDSIKEYINIIDEIIKEGINKKEIKKDNDEIIAYNIFQAITSTMLYRNNIENKEDIEKLYNNFCNILIYGIKNKTDHSV